MQTEIDMDQLIWEIGALELTEVDVWRTVFTAIAVHKGWSHPQISRHLGCSIERVRQRVNRLEHHLGKRDMPILSLLFKETIPIAKAPPDYVPVAFLAEDWKNQEFALGLIAMVASE